MFLYFFVLFTLEIDIFAIKINRLCGDESTNRIFPFFLNYKMGL